MGRRKYLRSNQTAVLDDLFSGEFDEQAVLDKHKVTRNTYNKWLADKRFAEEFSRRIACAYRQSEALIARYSAVAAAKLVQLIESDKPETARRACLDIISLPRLRVKKKVEASKLQKDDGQQKPRLAAETASKLLTVLAEDKKKAAAGDGGE
jgi:hypothetical protein